MMRQVLRASAIAVAAAAAFDPAIPVQRTQPVPVELRVLDPADPRADDVRRRLTERLGDAIDLSERRPPSHVVWIGNVVGDERRPADVPVSAVVLARADAPNVFVASVRPPAGAVVRQSVAVEAVFEAWGHSGRSSVLYLESGGVAVATAQHRWTADRERFTARFSHAPPAAGVHQVRVGARPSPAETDSGDNHADLSLTVDDRVLEVLVYEPRPSWNATFIRRALEADSRFRVSSVARASRSVSTRDTRTPAAVAAVPERLDAFDVVIVGAPEELRANEVEALARFARVRGGTVVFAPDRRTAGAYSPLVGATRFDEVLLENPARLVNDVAPELRASEFIVPRPSAAVAVSLATVPESRTEAGFVRPFGAGRIVFWGAADAWRFRAAGVTESDALRHGAFAGFWQSVIADLAGSAPPGLAVDVFPRTVLPGRYFRVRAVVRNTEFREAGTRLHMPAVAARLVGADGAVRAVRLWPSAETGVFVGRVRTAVPGAYDLHVTAGERSADVVVHVSDRAMRQPQPDGGRLHFLAHATGGIAATDADLRPLEAHLRGLATARELHAVRPMRSTWWFGLFAACLCGEWFLRRRRGLK